MVRRMPFANRHERAPRGRGDFPPRLQGRLDDRAILPGFDDPLAAERRIHRGGSLEGEVESAVTVQEETALLLPS